jgi:aminoglycoside phosphotransferase (APT) family kinase protein
MTEVQGLTDPRPGHEVDERALGAYLRERLDEFTALRTVQQFESGQSNPTFLLTADDRRQFVLRKKPPGKLLPSAHMVEREFRICSALAETDVPVPKMVLLCEDASIIGTSFYVMQYVEGRVLSESMLGDVPPADRRAIYDDMNRVLAALHTVDYKALGLENYGKPGNYFVRQFGRWSKQYEAAKTHDLPAMDALMQWLETRLPDDDTTTIVHGDYRLFNMVCHPTEPRVAAVLDWELSTLGHPLADLAYTCMRYYTPLETNASMLAVGGDSGIPTEEQFVQQYCQRTGRDDITNWEFYLAFSYFRLASIVQGVYKRGLQGNASSPQALTRKDVVDRAANLGWQLAKKADGSGGSK